MKTHTNQRLLPGLARLLGGFALFTGALHAAPFLYSPGDLVLAFRQTGNDSDYVVNLGKATNYNTLPAGTTVPVANLSAAQLNSAFPSLNGLKWSVAGANRPPLDPNYPLQTLWIARPRTESGAQSTPWLRKGQSAQGLAGAQIDGVGYNAAQASSNLPGGPANTATGVVIPVNNNFNVSQVIGATGNYANTFQGNVENLTADDFDGTPANVSRSDLFELLPGTTAAGTVNTAGHSRAGDRHRHARRRRHHRVLRDGERSQLHPACHRCGRPGFAHHHLGRRAHPHRQWFRAVPPGHQRGRRALLRRRSPALSSPRQITLSVGPNRN
jgi:hypothetical protein